MANVNSSTLPRTLRLVGCAFTITAGTVMIYANQSNSNSSNLAPYWCFVVANFILSLYSLLFLCLPSKSQLWQLSVALDLILTVITISSNSAALTVAIMENNGNSHYGWCPICHTFPTYCLRVFLAIGFGFFGSSIYIIVQLLCIQQAFNPILLD